MNRAELIAMAIQLLTEELQSYGVHDNEEIAERIANALKELNEGQVSNPIIDLIDHLGDRAYDAYKFCMDSLWDEGEADAQYRRAQGDDHGEVAGKCFQLAHELTELINQPV